MNQDSLRVVAYKTVDAFSGITDRKLWLKNASKASTDGNQISAPLDDPQVLRYVEKLLAHVLFQTNQEMIAQFSEGYATKIAGVFGQFGTVLEIAQFESLRDLIAQLANILEVRRVTSLWGLIYEGSFAQIKFLKKLLVKPYAAQAHQTIPILVALREAEVVVPDGKFSAFIPQIDEALKLVERRGPVATLAVLKWLIIKIIDVMIAHEKKSPTSVQQRASAMQELLTFSYKLPDKLGNYYGQVKQSTFQGTFAESIAKKEAAQALDAPIGDPTAFQSFLDQTADKMMQAVNKAKLSMSSGNASPSMEEWVSKDASAKVVFHEVTVADLAEYHAKISAQAPILLPEDQVVIRRLRNLFARIKSKRIHDVYESGLVIDSMAYIQYALSRQQRPIFKEEQSGRGFDVLVLMDRSSSMGGAKKQQVERAGRILAKALDYPFVKLHVWGFQSLEVGQVDIFRFDPKLETYDSLAAQVGGFTPLHIAAHVASKYLGESQNVRHMFVISDGVPNYHRRDGLALNREQLVGFVRKEILAARSKGVGVTGAVIPTMRPTKIGGKIVQQPDYSRRGQVKSMFGPQRHWRYLDPTNIGLDLVRLVADSFADYLRSA